MYVAALLAAAGIPCAFVTVAADPLDPAHFTHVYVAAYPAPGVRVAMDASHGDYAGWECPNRYGRRVEWPLGESSQGEYVTLGIMLLIAGAVWYAAARKAKV
jgi:hypothetical protein